MWLRTAKSNIWNINNNLLFCLWIQLQNKKKKGFRQTNQRAALPVSVSIGDYSKHSRLMTLIDSQNFLLRTQGLYGVQPTFYSSNDLIPLALQPPTAKPMTRTLVGWVISSTVSYGFYGVWVKASWEIKGTVMWHHLIIATCGCVQLQTFGNVSRVKCDIPLWEWIIGWKERPASKKVK